MSSGAAFDSVLDDGGFVLGDEVDAFEAEFAAYCGVRHCVGVGSGTAALTLALLAAGIRAATRSSSPRTRSSRQRSASSTRARSPASATSTRAQG